jgi:formylglycine-generating enzyme required for sulfatase activity
MKKVVVSVIFSCFLLQSCIMPSNTNQTIIADKVVLEQKADAEEKAREEADFRAREEAQKKLREITDDRMMSVIGGTFQMGSNNNDNEKPVHEVTVNSFYLGTFEVTRQEYNSGESNSSNLKGNDFPVAGVTWFNAIKFLNDKSRKEGLPPAYSYGSGGYNTFSAKGFGDGLLTFFGCIITLGWICGSSGSSSSSYNSSTNGPSYHMEAGGDLLDSSGNITNDITKVKGYRLPTEAEWEYAARGGNRTKGFKFSGSNDINEVAWFIKNSEYQVHLVGVRKPNELGIYDLSGNMEEWCSDSFKADYYTYGPKINPYNNKAENYRVIRGGSLSEIPDRMQVTSRFSDNPGSIKGARGFRIARTANDDEAGTKLAGDLKKIKAGEEEQAKAEAEKKAKLDLILPEQEGMVRVFGGTFKMGSYNYWDQPIPLHEVTVSNFYIGLAEITRAEYTKAMGGDIRIISGENLPVDGVSWFDAIKFCNAKSKSAGFPPAYDEKGNLLEANGQVTSDITKVKGYRLPSEAEWEFSAGGGTESHGFIYSGSNDISEVGWYFDNSKNTPHEAGTKKANELGIFDMSGNVSEWCTDWYNDDYYLKGPGNNPYNAAKAPGRVSRGGNWSQGQTAQDGLRIVYRYSVFPSDQNKGQGFRLAKSGN